MPYVIYRYCCTSYDEYDIYIYHQQTCVSRIFIHVTAEFCSWRLSSSYVLLYMLSPLTPRMILRPQWCCEIYSSAALALQTDFISSISSISSSRSGSWQHVFYILSEHRHIRNTAVQQYCCIIRHDKQWYWCPVPEFLTLRLPCWEPETAVAGEQRPLYTGTSSDEIFDTYSYLPIYREQCYT